MLKHTCFTLLSLCLFSFSTPEPSYTLAYISTYQSIAIREMQRSGIPASITLAQGIHESSWGKGELASNSNNHFGIKCKKEWNGETYYIEDDDFVNGKLIKSCFRSYYSVDDSYIDHTDFLVDNERYNRLFSIPKSDYAAWAKGLQKCGYATDPNYAKKLIRTIEKYELYKYDEMPSTLAIEVNEVPSINGHALPQTISTNVVIEETVEIEETYTDIPAAFVLPDDYQRNAYVSKMGKVESTEIENTSHNTDNFKKQEAFRKSENRIANSNRVTNDIPQRSITRPIEAPSKPPAMRAPSYTVAVTTDGIQQEKVVVREGRSSNQTTQLQRRPRTNSSLRR